MQEFDGHDPGPAPKSESSTVVPQPKYLRGQFRLPVRNPSTARRKAMGRTLGIHEYGHWEKSRIQSCANRQIQEGGDLLIEGQMAHLILKVTHA